MSIIRVTQGDIFESDAHTLVNTVNTVGVMGKGVALGFKQRFPGMFDDYRRRSARGEVRLGEPYLFRRSESPWIINFPTKGHWRSPSKLRDIERGLVYLVERIERWEVQSLAVPPLGCGNGELEWRVVGPVIYERLAQLDIPVAMYAPFGTPLVQLEESFLLGQLELLRTDQAPPEFKVTPAAVALVEVLARLESNPLAPSIGRIAFQKLAYFATQTEIPTGLHFERGSYGPFSRGLKNVITRLVNNSLIEERSRGNLIGVLVGPGYARARGNFEADLEPWRAAIDRLVDLVSRTSTSEAEIAATVHYAAKELNVRPGPASELDVYRYVDAWKPAKFTPNDVATAIRNLAMLGWLDVTASRNLPLPATASSSAV